MSATYVNVLPHGLHRLQTVHTVGNLRARRFRQQRAGRVLALEEFPERWAADLGAGVGQVGASGVRPQGPAASRKSDQSSGRLAIFTANQGHGVGEGDPLRSSPVSDAAEALPVSSRAQRRRARPQPSDDHKAGMTCPWRPMPAGRALRSVRFARSGCGTAWPATR